MTGDDRPKSWINKALPAVPAVAVLLVVVSSWFARSTQTVAARIYGGPPSADTLAWRVVVSLRESGFYQPVAHTRITITLATHPPVSVEGQSDNEGAWEARIPLPPTASGQIRTSITQPDSNIVLLDAPVTIDPPAWHSSFARAAPPVPGRSSGALDVRLSLSRSIMASAFAEEAIVRVSRDGAPVTSAALSLSGSGLMFDPISARTNSSGVATIRVTPTFTAPEITIRAVSDDAEGVFEGILPVKSGALWVDPDALARGTITVASQVRSQAAYLTLFTEKARLWGGRLTLQPNDQHGASGTMPLPPIPDTAVWLMASPDPQGTGAESELFAWPIVRGQGPQNAAHVSTPILGDGMPQALARAREQKRAAKLRALLIIAVAAVLEAGFLVLRARQAKQELERVIASHADVDEAVTRALVGGHGFWLKLVVAAFLVAIGFGALAFVTWMGAM